MIALALLVLASAFSWGDFRQANPLTWVFVAGMLFLLVASPLFYLWMETHRLACQLLPGSEPLSTGQ